jgi:hypothetical protein
MGTLDVRETIVYVNVGMTCYDLVFEERNDLVWRKTESGSRVQLPVSEGSCGVISHNTSLITSFLDAKVTCNHRQSPYDFFVPSLYSSFFESCKRSISLDNGTIWEDIGVERQRRNPPTA